MGLDLASIQLLCCAKNIGVDFTEALMIGRQEILCGLDEARRALSAAGIAGDCAREIRKGEFGEPVYRLMGAKNIYSLDGSDYEKANIVCDLNGPCPDSLKKRFSIVHDGGTLEHVFNIAQAFKTCMEMVRIGGSFVQVTAANNFMGHGFWQLSPETMFRIFCKENGYKIKTVLLRVVERNGNWYRVYDPAEIGWRAELVNRQRTYICTIAQRIEDASIFDKYPYQSDYAKSWERTKSTQQLRSKPAATQSLLRRAVPRPVRKIVRKGLDTLKRERLGFDQPYYRYISDNDLVRGRIGKIA
jgi:hypothetical protein